MRLLNVNTLKFEEFAGEPGNGVPPYAILWHVWGKEEVSFRDMMVITPFWLSARGSRRLFGAVQKQSLKAMNLRGLIRAASIKRGVLSSLRLSTLCFDGIERLLYAMPT